ncbi:MAG: BlaI/MecI/CopY family transcriptional regulator [Angelakisella sp.]
MAIVKISDAELPIMKYIWKHAPITAAQLVAYAAEEFEWNKNTTYTVIKRLCDRGALLRSEPNFVITPLVTCGEVQRAETDELIDKVYEGSLKMFLLSFFQREDLSQAELSELKELIAHKEKDMEDG